MSKGDIKKGLPDSHVLVRLAWVESRIRGVHQEALRVVQI